MLAVPERMFQSPAMSNRWFGRASAQIDPRGSDAPSVREDRAGAGYPSHAAYTETAVKAVFSSTLTRPPR